MKSELTQIREGNRKVYHWRIVAGILVLLLVQAVLGRMDSEARLAEAERIAHMHPSTRSERPFDGLGVNGETAKPPAPLQRQALAGCRAGGVL